MADPVLDAIQAVREDVRTNHEMLTRRLDQMVSKDVHDAEMRRIDAVIEAQKAAFDSHVSVSAKAQASLKTQVIDGDNTILQRISEQEAAQAEKNAADKATAKSDRRWMLGWVATLCTVAVSVASLITRFFGA